MATKRAKKPHVTKRPANGNGGKKGGELDDGIHRVPREHYTPPEQGGPLTVGGRPVMPA